MGKLVWVVNHQGKVPRFLQGKILRQTGYNTYLIRVNDKNRFYHTHQINFDNLNTNNLTKYDSFFLTNK